MKNKPKQQKLVTRIAIIFYAVATLVASIFVWCYKATSVSDILIGIGSWSVGVAVAGLIILFWRWLIHRKNGGLPSIDERVVQLVARLLLILLCIFFMVCCIAVLALVFTGTKQVATTTLLMVLFWSILVMAGSITIAFLKI